MDAGPRPWSAGDIPLEFLLVTERAQGQFVLGSTLADQSMLMPLREDRRDTHGVFIHHRDGSFPLGRHACEDVEKVDDGRGRSEDVSSLERRSEVERELQGYNSFQAHAHHPLGP